MVRLFLEGRLPTDVVEAFRDWSTSDALRGEPIMELRYDYTLDEAVEAQTWAITRSQSVLRAQRAGAHVGRIIGCFLGFLLAVPAYEFLLRTIREVLANDGVEFLPGEIDMLHPIRVSAVLAGVITVAIVWVVSLGRQPRQGSSFQ